MRKVHLWFRNHIAELNEEMANADSFEKEEIRLKLVEAWKMQVIVSDFIDWDDNEEEE